MKKLHLLIAILSIFIFSSCSQYQFVSAKKSYKKEAVAKNKKKQPSKVATVKKQKTEKLVSVETEVKGKNVQPAINSELKPTTTAAVETEQAVPMPIDATPKYDYTEKVSVAKPLVKNENYVAPSKREMRKDLKKVLKAYKPASDTDTLLLVIIAFFIPFLAVGLYDGITGRFWLSLILTLLFWLPGFIYALIVILE